MPKAISLNAYQNMSNYKKPTSIDVQESFKFPPYSTVIGMIHKVCNFKEYVPMQISIQGKYKSSVSNMYTRYFFGSSYDVDRHQYCINNIDGSKDGIIRGLGYAELVIDVDLIIHIKPDDENMFDIILQGLRNPVVFPALGRHEDLLRIDSVIAVELEEAATIPLYNDAYIPIKYFRNATDVVGTVYTLNKEFNKNEPGKIRTWKEKVKVKYIKEGEYLRFAKKIYKEKNSDIGVFFA